MQPIYNWEFVNRISGQENGTNANTALWFGGGSSTNLMADGGVADRKFIELHTKTTATSGDNRGIYWWHYYTGAGGGDVARLCAVANTTSVATGGTMTALHASARVASACSISGAATAIRATIESSATAPGGTGSALQLASQIITGATLPASWAFIRVTDDDATRCNVLLNIPAASNGTLFATHTTDAVTHSIKCITAAGTVFYIMCTTTATNRGA
jgi:hypothetical protein